MQRASFDPGFTQQYNAELRRSINPDGSFNVRRQGIREINVYHALIRMRWTWFFICITCAFVATNLIFASLYMLIGIDHLKGVHATSTWDAMTSAFFFSVHTLTTVGYGNMTPDGLAANSIAALEAMIGLLGFALATGLLYGRFSKPSARILFSSRMIIAPYQEGSALMFRIANARANVLMEIEATVMLMSVTDSSAHLKRSYDVLNLERPKVYFLPLTWTVVHPIDPSSPLYGKSEQDLKAAQTEVLVLIKAFDDTFSQTVHARYSYRHDEVIWDARYPQIFHVDEKGDMILQLDRLHEVVPANGDVLPAPRVRTS